LADADPTADRWGADTVPPRDQRQARVSVATRQESQADGTELPKFRLIRAGTRRSGQSSWRISCNWCAEPAFGAAWHRSCLIRCCRSAAKRRFCG